MCNAQFSVLKTSVFEYYAKPEGRGGGYSPVFSPRIQDNCGGVHVLRKEENFGLFAGVRDTGNGNENPNLSVTAFLELHVPEGCGRNTFPGRGGEITPPGAPACLLPTLHPRRRVSIPLHVADLSTIPFDRST